MITKVNNPTQVSQKIIRLRAFHIKNNLLTSTSNITSTLLNKLQITVVKDRCMLLNQEDQDKEQDVVSYYNSQIENKIFATLLRVREGGDVSHISSELLNSKTFQLEQLFSTVSEFPAVYINHSYFCLDEHHLVASLPLNKTIKSLETYINWLLNISSFELNPVIMPQQETKLSDLKNITIKNPFTAAAGVVHETQTHKKSISLTGKIQDIIKHLCLDVQSLSEIDVSQIISAELILNISKPRKMSEAEYQRIYGAILKPVADTENIRKR